MSSRSRTRAPLVWDPETVLKVDNMGRCAGWAKTRGRNCANAIAFHNQQNADNLLRTISTKEPDAIALEDDLYRLAGLVLCRRWHQDQADDMVDNWSARIQRLAAARVRSSRASSTSPTLSSRMSSSPSIPSSRTSSTSSTPSRRASEASSPTTSPSLSDVQVHAMDAMRERIAQLEATIAALNARGAAPQETTATRATPPAQSTPTTSLAPPTTATTPTRATPPPVAARATQTTPPTPAVTAPQRLSTLTNSQSPRPSPSTTPPPAPQRACSTPHVRRRAVDDDCPICHDAFLADEALVWCKRECGRTVHKTCFADWEKACRDDGKAVTCGICRAAWGRECGC